MLFCNSCLSMYLEANVLKIVVKLYVTKEKTNMGKKNAKNNSFFWLPPINNDYGYSFHIEFSLPRYSIQSTHIW